MEKGRRDCVPFDNKLKNLQQMKMKIYLRSSRAKCLSRFSAAAISTFQSFSSHERALSEKFVLFTNVY